MATLEVLEKNYTNNIDITDIIKEKDVPLHCPASMSGGGIFNFLKSFKILECFNKKQFNKKKFHINEVDLSFNPTPEPTFVNINDNTIKLEFNLTELPNDIWENIINDILPAVDACRMACTLKYFKDRIIENLPEISKITNDLLLNNLKNVVFNESIPDAHIIDIMYKIKQYPNPETNTDIFYLHIFATALKNIDLTANNDDLYIVLKILKHEDGETIKYKERILKLINKDQSYEFMNIINIISCSKIDIFDTLLKLMDKWVSSDDTFHYLKLPNSFKQFNIVELVHIHKFHLPKNSLETINSTQLLKFIMVNNVEIISSIKKDMTLSEKIKTYNIFTNITESNSLKYETILREIIASNPPHQIHHHVVQHMEGFNELEEVDGGNKRRVLHLINKRTKKI